MKAQYKICILVLFFLAFAVMAYLSLINYLELKETTAISTSVKIKFEWFLVFLSLTCTALLIAFLIILNDLIQKHKFEAKLLNTNSRLAIKATEKTIELEKMLVRITDGFISYDRDWNHKYVNDKAAEILSSKREDLIKKNLFDLLPDIHRYGFWDKYQEAIRTQKVIHYRYKVQVNGKILDTIIYPDNDGLSVFLRDITEELKNEEFNEAMINRLLLAAKATNDILWDWNLVDNSIWWNENFTKEFQYKYNNTKLESIQIWYDMLHADDSKRVVDKIHRSIDQGEESWYDEYRIVRKDGSIVNVYDRGYILKDDYGKPVRMIGAIQDITERVKSQETANHLVDIIENTPDLVSYSDINFNLIFINKSGREMLKISSIENFRNSSMKDYYPSAIYTFLKEVAMPIAIKNGTWHGESIVKSSDGKMIPVYQIIIAHKKENGELNYVSTVMHDIREIKKSQEQLTLLNAQLRNLSSHLQNIVEEERKRIAREIHDELGQELTAMKIFATDTYKEFPTLSEQAQIKLKGFLALINKTIQSVQRLAISLRPAILDDLGLVAALDWQIGEFRKWNQIEVVYDQAIVNESIEQKISISVFRILQEALTNIARHSKATKVNIEFNESDENLMLSIRDNGKGFDVKEHSGSLGLIGMKERALMIDATLTIESVPGKGTLIFLKVPIFSNVS